MRVASVGDYRRRELQVIGGQPPGVGAEISGCRFAARCPEVVDACGVGPVATTTVVPGHGVRCVKVTDPVLVAR
jgi:peptide/nickel transport system ATP-binding protein